MRRCCGVLIAAAGLTLPRLALAEPTLPVGFQAQRVIVGLNQPVAVSFATDGRAFVAEKGGRILSFAALPGPAEAAKTPRSFGASVFRDLSADVQDFWDRGLLGLTVAPSFPLDRRVFVFYSRDQVAGTLARWGDGCPDPPGGTRDGCAITQRLSVLTASATDAGLAAAGERTLIDGWCMQYPSHAVGTLTFGNDGSLYASAGDGAGFEFSDTGNGGGSVGSPTPANPCGDGHTGDRVGVTETGPGAEGGALRAQDLRTPDDPTSLSGTIVRLDPATGLAAPGNPLSQGRDENARRIVAHGLRNPFRFTTRPDRAELWLGDVGGSSWEEINVVADPTRAAPNFGWPCEEGPFRSPSFDLLDVSLCETLYAEGSAARPYFTYEHGGDVARGDVATAGRSGVCPAPNAGGDSITALGFAPTTGNRYPGGYKGALFFGDYSRRCIWTMPIGANGLPDTNQISRFLVDAAPVQLVAGPGGDLYYVDVVAGEVRRIRFVGPSSPPQASLDATPLVGPAPLAVTFDASQSSDPDSGVLTFDWDLNGDGLFGDAVGAVVKSTYVAGDHDVSVRVTDPSGLTDVASVTVISGDTPPRPTIATPIGSLRWRVGQRITAIGFAADDEEGRIAPTSLKWSLELLHCSRQNKSACHYHRIESSVGDQFGVTAPDHPYPASLVLKLTATDARGVDASAFVRLEPETTQVTYDTRPSGGVMTIGDRLVTGPVTQDEIIGGRVAVTAPESQRVGGVERAFATWSDGVLTARRTVVVQERGGAVVARLANSAPMPSIRVDGPSRNIPATIRFDASGSRDADVGDPLTFAWDLDGDGTFDDGSGPTASRTYSRSARLRPAVRVTDGTGAYADLATRLDVLPVGAVAGAVKDRCRFRARYYRRENLSGTPTVTRCESAVFHDWGKGRPLGRIPRDHFGARWTGRYRFARGVYRFEASADDALRLLIDGKLIIDGWKAGSYSPTKVDLPLRKGVHRVRVDYLEHDAGARVSVGWRRLEKR